MPDLPFVCTAGTLQCDTQETHMPSTWQRKQLHPIPVACQQTWKTLPAERSTTRYTRDDWNLLSHGYGMFFKSSQMSDKKIIRGHELKINESVFSLPSYFLHFAKRGTTQRQISFLWNYFKGIGHPDAKSLKWIWTHQNTFMNLVLMSWGSLPSKRKGELSGVVLCSY